MGTEAVWGAIAAAAISAAGTAYSVSQSGKRPKGGNSGMPAQQEASPDEGKQRLEEEERLRQRRGRASTLLQGEAGPSQVATTQSGGKTLLGG